MKFQDPVKPELIIRISWKQKKQTTVLSSAAQLKIGIFLSCTWGPRVSRAPTISTKIRVGSPSHSPWTYAAKLLDQGRLYAYIPEGCSADGNLCPVDLSLTEVQTC